MWVCMHHDTTFDGGDIVWVSSVSGFVSVMLWMCFGVEVSGGSVAVCVSSVPVLLSLCHRLKAILNLFYNATDHITRFDKTFLLSTIL